MKAYKISNNSICKNNFKFEVGKTYEQEDKLELCSNGFHFCKNQDDLFRWYDYNPKTTVIFEVEILGDIIDSDEGDKSVTNKLKILRIIPFEEYNELFSDIHFEDKFHLQFKDLNGFKEWSEYDSNGNEIYSKDSDEFEEWKEYDSNGNLIHYKNSNEYEEWKEYDSNNNMIYLKESNGYEYWKEFDSNSKLIHFKNSNSREEYYEYDNNGILINIRTV